MLDLFNEPDVYGLQWEAPSTRGGTTFPPLADLYMAAGQALYDVDPQVLLLLEGTGQSKIEGGAWGNGARAHARACVRVRAHTYHTHKHTRG